MRATLQRFYAIALIPLLLSAPLFAADAERVDGYWEKILRCGGSVRAPDFVSNYWTGLIIVQLDCGFHLISSSKWMHQSQAERYSQISFDGEVLLKPSGHNGEINMLRSDGNQWSGLEIWITHGANLVYLPVITTFAEVVKEEEGFLWPSYTFQYLVELSDGSSFETPEMQEQLEPWEIGTQVKLIGKHEQPWMINVSAASSRDLHKVKQHDLLRLQPSSH